MILTVPPMTPRTAAHWGGSAAPSSYLPWGLPHDLDDCDRAGVPASYRVLPKIVPQGK